METVTFDVEYTDTFGGEANYCWVCRAEIAMPRKAGERASRRALMRRAKAEMGLTGIRGKSSDYGDSMEFRPYGMATVLFVTYRD